MRHDSRIIVVKARVTVNNMISPCRLGEARMTNWWTVPDWRSPPGEVQHSSRVWGGSVTQAGVSLHFAFYILHPSPILQLDLWNQIPFLPQLGVYFGLGLFVSAVSAGL